MKPLRDGQVIYGKNGREYKIKLVTKIKSGKDMPEGWEVYGQIDRLHKIIRIRKGIDCLDQYMYLLHELIHDHAEDWEEFDLTKEMFVSIFTGELFDCLRRNKLGFV